MINCSRFGPRDPDSQPNWLHWAELLTPVLRYSEVSTFWLFHSLLLSEPKGVNQFPRIHQRVSYKALLLVLEPSEQIMGTVLSRNSVNDEKKREMTMDFPQPSSFTWHVFNEGSLLYWPLTHFGNSPQMFACDFFIFLEGEDLQPRLGFWDATYL